MTFRPGTLVTSRSDPPSRGVISDTGTWFVVGAAEKGPTAGCQVVRNMTEFGLYFGSRQSYSLLYDSLETFFHEGGARAYVARVVGSSAASASKTVQDSTPANSLVVTAANPGVWGNSLLVQVIAGAASGERILVITHTTLGEVDRSPSLATLGDAVSWGRSSSWVDIAIAANAVNLPAVAGATAFTGGVDDNTGITDASRQAALAFFTRDLGPGQVSIPGNTTLANRNALIAHARANNRQALLDNTDVASAATIVTEATTVLGDEYGAMFAPWVQIPGLVTGTTRTVPPSALVAGLMARSDSTNSPNVAAAGDNGLARFAVDVTQPAWSDSDRDSLNSSGVNVIRNTRGDVTLYGYRTLANPLRNTAWVNLANQRLRLKISSEAGDIAESFLFDEIDGRGHKIAEFAGALTGMLNNYFLDGSLYGDTPNEAFSVDVGETVNTVQTLANNELHAVITLRMSPFAELVMIEIAKVGVAQNI